MSQTVKRESQPSALSRTFEPKFLEDLDHRYAAAKLMRERYAAVSADCGAEKSAQRDLLARRATFLSVVLETQECNALQSGAFDAGIYCQAVNTLIGLFRALGIERPLKNARDLRSYLSERADKAEVDTQ